MVCPSLKPLTDGFKARPDFIQTNTANTEDAATDGQSIKWSHGPGHREAANNLRYLKQPRQTEGVCVGACATHKNDFYRLHKKSALVIFSVDQTRSRRLQHV